MSSLSIVNLKGAMEIVHFRQLNLFTYIRFKGPLNFIITVESFTI